MSAIAGILGRVDDAANRAAIECMSAAMAHRGPDGHGTWTSDADAQGNGCLLAHRRLVTLDTSHQPLVNGDKTLVTDATIFTHPQGGDVLRDLAHDAPAGLAKLRGAFALALWDGANRQLLLARDPLGHKPLYCCLNPDRDGAWSLAFASELRALLASGLLGDKPRLDPAGVASFLWNGFVMSPLTLVRGVESLLPGVWRKFGATGKRIDGQPFWRMPVPATPKAINDDESVIRAELRESVRLNMQHDESAPIGVLLSAGIDSSSIANLAQLQRDGKRPIKTFCLAVHEESFSEGDAAGALANAMGTKHHEYTLTEQEFVATLDDAIAALDQPTFDALNQYHICRAVRAMGMKIAVGGIGGDAIFGGDKTLRQLPQLHRAARLTRWLPESARVAAATLVASAMSRGSGGSPIGSQQNWAKLPDVARANGDVLALYQLTYALFLPEFQRELLEAAAPTVSEGLPDATRDWLGGEIHQHAPIEAAAILETRCFVGERLLRDADTVSSALSFELRSPLSDPRLIEALSRLPVERKFQPVGFKPLLRKYGLEGVDPKLYDRPKSGFVLPFDRWIRKNLGKVMDQTMRDERACRAAGLNPHAVARLWEAFVQGVPGLYWTRVWAVYVLIRWCQRHGLLV
ncbi:MAG: asparagine synthase-related protein [Tepidisphaeraceae bacterium]